MSAKRNDYISWDSYFFMLAFTASLRSKDPSTRNGACIVCPKSLSPISMGYNGLPRGCNDDEFPWSNDKECFYENKYPYVEHAERNAIFNAARNGISTEGCTLYLFSEKGYLPCEECARAIIQSGIKNVKVLFVAKEVCDKWRGTGSLKMFEHSKVNLELCQKLDSIKNELKIVLQNIKHLTNIL